MPTTTDAIYGRLTASADLTALLVGGIYKRPLKRGSTDSAGRLVPPGATPQAFSGAHVRPAAVVIDRGEQQVALPPITSAYAAFPEIWFYARAGDTGKTQLATAWELAYSLLHGWSFAGPQLTGVETTVVGRLGMIDDPALEGALVDRMRLQLAGLWRDLL